MSDDGESRPTSVVATSGWSDSQKLLAAMIAGPFALIGIASAVAQLYDYVEDGKYSPVGAGVGFVVLGVCLVVGFTYLRERSRSHPGRVERWSTRVVVGAMALSILTTLAVAATVILSVTGQSPPSVPVSDPVVTGPAPSAPSAPADGDVAGSVGRATLRADLQTPAGCSSTYRLTGEILALPTPPATLWIVSVLPAGPPNGLKDTQHYPKTRIDARLGPFELDVPGNTNPGTRRGRLLLVAADAPAGEELQLSLRSDREKNEEIYPDGNRVQLPVGAYEIARTVDLDQTCP